MNKKIGRILKSFIFFFLLFFSPFIVKAATSASASLSGNNSVYVGSTVDITLVVNESNSTDEPGKEEGVTGIQGLVSFDTTKLELVSTKSLNLNVDYHSSSGRIAGMVTSVSQYLRGTKNIMIFTFKAKTTGSANVSIKADISDAAGAKIFSKMISKTIKIIAPPSSNNNLSSLSVSVGNISFNKNTTSYSVNVDSNVTSANITAKAEDSGAKVSGTGSKTLGYGSNKINVVVTAPSGAQKTYTVNIIRKDNRSSNNNLSSLKVNDGELSPKFSKNITSYSLSVPYSVSNLTVNTKTEDLKATVQVSGNKNLVAESSNKVTVTITAENGSKKTYTINVTRGKDPNKKLSNNNYLTYLKPSIGILSPVFNKEKTNYEIWLPYEVDKISFDYGVEDTKYATTKFTGNDILQPGVSNIYKITVTSESNEERVYNISVKRAKNPSENNSSNTYLQNIKLKNGKIVGSFDKEKREYYYTRNKGFQIEDVKPEDSNSAVTVIEEGNIIYFVVTSASGENSVYTLREKETNVTKYFIYLILFIIGFIVGFITHKIIKNKKIYVKNKKSNIKI